LSGQWDVSRFPDFVEKERVIPVRGRGNLYYPLKIEHASAYNYSPGQMRRITDARSGTVLAEVDFLGQTGIEGRGAIIGNLLIITSDHETPHGVATYDLSDPSRPKLLDAIRTTPDGRKLNKAYQTLPIWGHHLFLMMNGASGSFKGYDVIDFSDPTQLRWMRRVHLSSPRPRYVQFQDEYMFVDDMKIDVHTDEIVQTFPDAGGEYQLPVGHLLVTAGMDRKDTGRVWAHQATLDRRGPMVTWHLPRDGAVDQAVTTRVGLVIPETLDAASVQNKVSIIVRPLGGAALDGVVQWNDHDIMNFAPEEPLQPDTTYEVILPAEGIKDVAGNGIETEFRFVFATGSTIGGGNVAPVVERLEPTPVPALVGDTVQVDAVASDADGDTLRYSWDFGDGANTDTGTAASTSHRYTSAGRFALSCRVSDGRVTTLATRTVVVGRPGGQAGTRSSSVVVDAGRDRVWNVNPGNHSVSCLDAATGDQLFEVSVGADPRSLALAPDGSVWVACHDADAIHVLSGSDGTELAHIALDYADAPIALAFAPDGGACYLSCSCSGSGRLLRLDPATRGVTGSLAVGPTPRALAVTADGGRVLVNRFTSGSDRGEVRVIDTAGWQVASTVALAIDTSSLDSNLSARGLPNYLLGLAIRPDGALAWVGGKKDNMLAGLGRDGTELSFETSQRALIASLDLAGPGEDLAARLDIDNQELPAAICFAPDSTVAFVAFQGNNEVVALDTTDGQIVARTAVGRAPQGLAFDARRQHLYVHEYLSRSVSVLAVGEVLAGRASTMPRRVQVDTVASERLAAEVLAGKRLFYQASDPRISADGYLSCAGCHLDGGHDGRTWDFTQRGEGLRNTTSLHGRRGTGHGNVHWTGNFDEIHDFEHDIRGAFGGSGLLTDAEFTSGTRDRPLGDPKAGLDADLDALAAYVASLDAYPASPHREADGGLTAAAVAGEATFRRLDCQRCHAGPDFTDSVTGLRHDVGTLTAASGQRLGGALDGIDTPTLLGLHDTAPYFHDGSAATLLEVVQRSGPTHGDMAALSSAERQQLIAYLQQLDGGSANVGPVPVPLASHHWRFDGDASDSAGSIDGILTGGAGADGAGVAGRALVLDGAAAFCDIADAQLEDGFARYSVALWFRADRTAGSQHLYEEGGQHNWIGLRLDGDTLQAAVRSGGTQHTASVAGVAPGTWTFAVMTFDGDLHLYVGDAAPVTMATVFAGIPGHGSPAAVGGMAGDSVFAGGDGERFAGLIDELRIWDGRALTAAQVRALYRAHAPGNTPPAVSLSADPDPVAGTSTTLTATATDADGDPLDYAFSVQSQPVGAAAQLSGTGASRSVIFDQVGGYTFQVQVDDGRGGQTTASVGVTVQASPRAIVISP